MLTSLPLHLRADLPRGIRNNNPGNLRRTAPPTPWRGLAEQQMDSQFLCFASAEWGLRALMLVLLTYARRHGLNTVRAIVNRWAPPIGQDAQGHSYTQDTGSYAAFMGKRLGVTLDQPLNISAPATIEAMARAITAYENGRPPADAPRDWYEDAIYAQAVKLVFQRPTKEK